MIHKKHITAALLILGLLGTFVFLKRKSIGEREHSGITIGILQTASHPALDAVREGFMHELQEQIPHVQFIVQNAQGNVNNAHALAQSFHTNNQINAIFAIATPALQAMSSVEHQMPIFFGAVTEPRSLGLIHPSTNVTGSSDMINVPDTITMLKELIPTAKTVAVIYNSGEINSVAIAQSMKKELTKVGLHVLDTGITNEADLLPAIDHVLTQADVLLAPTDNTIASAINLIASQALQAKKPLIVSDNLLVSKGALAARGVDYTTNGKQAAQQAAAVLMHGKKPAELSVAYATSGRIFVNKKTADALGIHIPASLMDNVTLVEKE